jgi:hypothetical protein
MISAMETLGMWFVTGVALFAATSTVALILWLYTHYSWKRRSFGGWVTLINIMGACLYIGIYLDWNVLYAQLQISTGVEPAAVRNIYNAFVFVVNAYILTKGCYLDDGYMTILMGIYMGATFGLADIATGDSKWFLYGIGFAGMIQPLWVAARAPKYTWRIVLTLAGSLIFTVGLPVVQGCSYTMGQVLDKNPDRIKSEIAYFFVYMGNAVYQCLAILLFGDEIKSARAKPSQKKPKSKLRKRMEQIVGVPPLAE